MTDTVGQEFLKPGKLTVSFFEIARMANYCSVLTEYAPVVIVSTGSEMMFTSKIVFAKHHYH